MNQSLQGKVAIVTGATRGIGRAIAEELAVRGASVLITYVSASSAKLADDFVTETEKVGGKAAAVKADCLSVESPQKVIDATIKAFGGGIDIIINNAGVCEEILLKDITADHYEKIMATNVRFPLFLAQASLPYLRKYGRIVNISSVAAREGWRLHSVYSASKACMEAFARVWSIELGHEYGVTVNCVNPGPVETEMWYQQNEEELRGYEKYINTTPAAPRLAQPREIATIVAFLCEDGAKWITGSVTCANGGKVPT